MHGLSFSFRRLHLPLLGLAMWAASFGLGFADIPTTYYNAVNTATSATLRATLNDVISRGTTVISFASGLNGASGNAMRTVDEDPNNSANVILLYSAGESRSEVSTATANGSPTSGEWSREHVFPQSYYASEEPMVSDLHHLFPADADLNSTRNNKFYDTVTGPTYTDSYGNEADDTPDAFEVNPTDRGAAARALFYMDVRYEGEGAESDLRLAETTTESDSYTMARLSTILAWSAGDPVTAYELTRNNRAYNIQGNANPFIDHPEWISQLYIAPPAVNNGDLPTAGFTTRAAASLAKGAQNFPLLSINLTLASGQWDIQQIDVQELGSITDSEIAAAQLWLDANNNGIVDAGDPLLDTRTFSGGALTFTLSPVWRIPAGTRNLLVTADVSGAATTGATLQARIPAGGIRHAASGGSDLDPAYSSFVGGTSTVASSNGIKIVMVSTRSLTAAAEEFLVLANHDGAAVDLTGWMVVTSTGGSTNTLTIPSGSIPGFGHFVIASNSYAGTTINGVTINYKVATSGLVGTGISDTTGRSFGLINTSFAKVDGFSINGGIAVGDSLREGTAFNGGSGSTTLSYARKRPGGASGPYADTADNSADEEMVTSKTPPSDTSVPVELAEFAVE